MVKAIHQGFKVFQMGVDYFPRTRGISTLSSPAVILKMVRELTRLYPETRRPQPAKRPVRLPPSVSELGSARERSRGHG